MAKRFFYVSFGILCLVAAYQLGAEQARAEWEHNGFAVGTVDGRVIWNAMGEAYTIDPWTPEWDRATGYDLPVPGTDVKLLDGGAQWIVLVTTTDAVWVYDGGWKAFPSVPGGGPVSLEQRSWGSVKGGYR